MELFSFSGRANRTEFWLVGIGLTLAIMLFGLLAGFAASAIFSGLPAAQQGWVSMGLVTVATLLFAWPVAAVGVRRAHDRGGSGVWFIVYQIANIALSLWSTSLAPRGVDEMGGEAMMMGVASLPILGLALFLLVTLGFLPGQAVENRYGPKPGSRSVNYRSPAL